MAKKDSTGGNAPGITINSQRQWIGLNAACEIEKLCSVLRTVCTVRDDMEYLAIRGLSMRIEELSRIAISILDDDDSTSALSHRLHGERLEGVEA